MRNRIRNAYPNEDEAKIRIAMMEELASETLITNLPQWVKQWIRITKQAMIEDIVKTVEDEEEEEKEERWDDGRQKTGAAENRKRRPNCKWQRVEQQVKDWGVRTEAPTYTKRYKPREKTLPIGHGNRSAGSVIHLDTSPNSVPTCTDWSSRVGDLCVESSRWM